MSSLLIAEFFSHLHDSQNTEKVVSVSWEKEVGPGGESGFVVTEYVPPGPLATDSQILISTEVYATLSGRNEKAAEDRALKAALRRHRALRAEGAMNFKRWRESLLPPAGWAQRFPGFDKVEFTPPKWSPLAAEGGAYVSEMKGGDLQALAVPVRDNRTGSQTGWNFWLVRMEDGSTIHAMEEKTK